MNTYSYNIAMSKILFVFFLTAVVVTILASYIDFGEWLWLTSRQFETWEFDEILIALTGGLVSAFFVAVCQLTASLKKNKSEKSIKSQSEIEDLLLELKRDTIVVIEKPLQKLKLPAEINSRENLLTIRALEWVIGEKTDDNTPISKYR